MVRKRFRQLVVFSSIAIAASTACGARTELDAPATTSFVDDASDDSDVGHDTLSDNDGEYSGPPLKVFVTAGRYAASLGGLPGADAVCAKEAAAANLSGVYKAWLSDDSQSPSTRFIHSASPYARLDGVILASDWADLTDGTLGAPIRVTALGNEIPADSSGCFPPDIGECPWVCSNTLSSGVEEHFGLQSCKQWFSSDSGPQGSVGDLTSSAASWSGTNDDVLCSVLHCHLYCFEQP